MCVGLSKVAQVSSKLDTSFSISLLWFTSIFRVARAFSLTQVFILAKCDFNLFLAVLPACGQLHAQVFSVCSNNVPLFQLISFANVQGFPLCLFKLRLKLSIHIGKHIQCILEFHMHLLHSGVSCALVLIEHCTFENLTRWLWMDQVLTDLLEYPDISFIHRC